MKFVGDVFFNERMSIFETEKKRKSNKSYSSSASLSTVDDSICYLSIFIYYLSYIFAIHFIFLLGFPNVVNFFINDYCYCLSDFHKKGHL